MTNKMDPQSKSQVNRIATLMKPDPRWMKKAEELLPCRKGLPGACHGEYHAEECNANLRPAVAQALQEAYDLWPKDNYESLGDQYQEPKP